MDTQKKTTKTRAQKDVTELKNIKYKITSGVVGGSDPSVFGNALGSSSSLESVDDFLENETINNKSEPWNKLNKTTKIKKILVYAATYTEQHQLPPTESNALVNYLKDCLERKKLNKVKEVIYDKQLGVITDIPVLIRCDMTSRFTLKKMDKKNVTQKAALKGGAKKYAQMPTAAVASAAAEEDSPNVGDDLEQVQVKIGA